jgi:hypothetical protein
MNSTTTIPTVAPSAVDEHGNPTTGDTESIERYDASIDRLIRFHVDVVDQMSSLVDDHPSFAMGRALAAYMHLISTDPRDLDVAHAHATAMREAPRNDRESMHVATINTWLGGDWHGAARLLDDLLIEWPTDVLALMVGHQLDFFLGDARNLRDRVGRSIAAFDPRHPHHGFVRGMHAFGLEESGHYGPAEEAAQDALQRNPDDVWAVHAAAHVYEMQGRTDDGLNLMIERIGDWGSGNLFTVHNWWHLALYHLEHSRHDEVLAIYDREIHHTSAEGVPMEMLDAASMLWRLRLDGVDVGDRFGVIADSWALAIDDSPSWYAFNDVHAVMAFLGAGRRDDAVDVIQRLSSDAEDATTTQRASNVRMTAEVGLPVARGLVAFDDGRDADAIDELWSTRRVFHHFGGSHAQRDVIERTLLEAAIRGGRTTLARRLIAERLSIRPTGRFALDRARRLTDV